MLALLHACLRHPWTKPVLHDGGAYSLHMSRDPWDLAQAMSRRMNPRPNVPHRADADPLLAWASWQLNAAQFGFDIYQRALPLGDANGTGHPLHTVEIAALNLVFRGVVSAMDQCAGAVARLTGQMTRATRERDVGWWFEPRNKAAWRGTPPTPSKMARRVRWRSNLDARERASSRPHPSMDETRCCRWWRGADLPPRGRCHPPRSRVDAEGVELGTRAVLRL